MLNVCMMFVCKIKRPPRIQAIREVRHTATEVYQALTVNKCIDLALFS